jgi:hypothetical protein
LATHICEQKIDSDLQVGGPEAVQKISSFNVKGEERNCYSFATKYCNWHNHDSYLIYDGRMDKYPWTLQKQKHFASSFNANSDLKNYAKFSEVMIAFRATYGLDSFTFKEIDKFLWLYIPKTDVVDAASIQAQP